MKQSLLVFCISLLFVAGPAVAQPDTQYSADEIQVLIDVSGSMKQNDPQNLRTDATRLLINLLPDKARVSLWLFAEQTTLLSHSDAVDDAWRQEALKASASIHSRGLYTHIEDAIATALSHGFAGTGPKNLILLTDGMVDISKDIMVSADSRERILSEWIPKIRQQQVKVQTIALSDQVDKELLEKLAFDTDGWSETAESAEQLQRLFLKMAQKVAPKDTLPIDGNRFGIDASIQEFSVVVFKKQGAAPTQLIRPDQQKIDKQNALGDGIAWLDTPGYDLITVKQPMPGDWQIAAEIDPDDQVMVLTDLKLQLDGLANFIGEKDQLALKLHFTERGQLIDRGDFLELVKISLSVDHQEATDIATLNGQPGFFGKTLEGLAPGKHQISIVADGKTFKREIVRDIEVVSSPIRVEKQLDAANRQITLKFLPDTAILDTAALSITAEIRQADRPIESRPVPEQAGEWLLKLDSLPAGATLSVHFNVIAKTLDGNAITPALAPITMDDKLFAPPPSSPEQVLSTESETQAGKAPQNPPIGAKPATEHNWTMTVALVALANILLAGIGFFAYKTYKKATAKRQQQLLERLS